MVRFETEPELTMLFLWRSLLLEIGFHYRPKARVFLKS
jgi:hypothetical protein